MGFLKRFFHNVLRDGSEPMERNGFDRLPRVELESHLTVARYGEFWLTEAIRPSVDLAIVPQEGYRHSRYDDPKGGSMPVLMGSVTREKLFETFLDLLDPLGPVVDVVLETSHTRHARGSEELYREQIDLPVLKSRLYDHEDLLLNDGCTGIAVLNPDVPMEVQFDEHKLLLVYAQNLRTFETVFQEHAVRRNERMRFITEAEHLHSSRARHVDSFQSLQQTLGMDV